jgi:ribosome-binding ATPase YchF (GTP1/OBG family)
MELEDARLAALSGILPGRTVVPLAVDLYDFPGFTGSTSKKLVNRILREIRQSDLLVVVLQAEADVKQLVTSYKSFRDELVLLDYANADSALSNLKTKLRVSKRPSEDPRYKLLTRVAELLEGGASLHAELSPEEKDELKDLALLTLKPQLVVVNLTEEQYPEKEFRESVCVQFAEQADVAYCHPLPVALAAELSELAEDERESFRELYGIEGALVPPLKKALLAAMDHIVFFTFNEKEVRAWSVPTGATAVEAADAIHTDLARGFIRAEVIGAEELVELGSTEAAKSAGKLRTEGKDYPVRDGDVILVRFNV